MSFNIEGTSCAHCKAYLFAEDDIVYCPVCGAPHHRECYEALGHCALEEFHGTDRQYSMEKELETRQKLEEEKKKEIAQKAADNSKQESKCKFCGEVYPFEEKSCPKCSAPNYDRINGFNGFDLLGGVKPGQEIDDGIIAEDAQKFVMANTHRYIPKFVKLSGGKKASWNWLAFFFPSCWLLSRKMYKKGIAATLLLMISVLLAYPLTLYLVNNGFVNTDISQLFRSVEMIQSQLMPMSKNTAFIMAAAMLGTGFELAIRFVTAIFGDYWYKLYTVSSIRKIKSEGDDISEGYRKKGGVNVFLFLMGYILLQYVPSILLMLL